LNPQPDPPSFVEPPISTSIVGGTGNNDIRVSYAVNPQPEPSGMPTFNIPLATQITGGEGVDNIQVIYDFNPNPEPPGFPGIVLNAPITLAVDGG
jgi:hypothetical protein